MAMADCQSVYSLGDWMNLPGGGEGWGYQWKANVLLATIGRSRLLLLSEMAFCVLIVLAIIFAGVSGRRKYQKFMVFI